MVRFGTKYFLWSCGLWSLPVDFLLRQICCNQLYPNCLATAANTLLAIQESSRVWREISVKIMVYCLNLVMVYTLHSGGVEIPFWCGH